MNPLLLMLYCAAVVSGLAIGSCVALLAFVTTVQILGWMASKHDGDAR